MPPPIPLPMPGPICEYAAETRERDKVATPNIVPNQCLEVISFLLSEEAFCERRLEKTAQYSDIVFCSAAL